MKTKTVKIRKHWGVMSPVTKVVPDKTKYNRKRRKTGLWLLVD